MKITENPIPSHPQAEQNIHLHSSKCIHCSPSHFSDNYWCWHHCTTHWDGPSPVCRHHKPPVSDHRTHIQEWRAQRGPPSDVDTEPSWRFRLSSNGLPISCSPAPKNMCRRNPTPTTLGAGSRRVVLPKGQATKNHLDRRSPRQRVLRRATSSGEPSECKHRPRCIISPPAISFTLANWTLV